MERRCDHLIAQVSHNQERSILIQDLIDYYLLGSYLVCAMLFPSPRTLDGRSHRAQLLRTTLARKLVTFPKISPIRGKGSRHGDKTRAACYLAGLVIARCGKCCEPRTSDLARPSDAVLASECETVTT